MPLKDNYDFENLINESERLVIEEIERQLELSDNADACRCNECILDMAALALNQVRPVYRVSLLGSLYASNVDDSGYGAELHTGVANAITRVKANPSHPEG